MAHDKTARDRLETDQLEDESCIYLHRALRVHVSGSRASRRIQVFLVPAAIWDNS